MKLNNGKGWEAIKAHPNQAHLHHNPPNTSARDIHGNRISKTPVPPGRLDAELPKPGATRSGQLGAGQRHQSGRRDQYGQDYAKRRSAGGDLAPPEGSTAAQFANSSGNLPGRVSSAPLGGTTTPQQPSRQSTSAQMQTSGSRPTGAGATTTQQAQQTSEQKPSGMQKFLKVLCCG